MASPNPASVNCLQADEVVGLMSQAEVLQACRVYWNRETEVQAREAITKQLEKHLKCGVGRLSKMPLEKRAEMLAGQLRSPLYRQWAARVLHFYAVGKEEPPSLDTIFSVMPTLESNDAEAPIPLPTLVDTAETLLKNYPQLRVLILLASLIAFAKPTWQKLPAALDQIGVKLRTSLAESRDAQGDPRIAALTAEVESPKAQLAKQKEVLAQSEERFVVAQTAHRSEVALRSEEIENLKAEQQEAISSGLNWSCPRNCDLGSQVRENLSACQPDAQIELWQRVSLRRSQSLKPWTWRMGHGSAVNGGYHALRAMKPPSRRPWNIAHGQHLSWLSCSPKSEPKCKSYRGCFASRVNQPDSAKDCTNR